MHESTARADEAITGTRRAQYVRTMRGVRVDHRDSTGERHDPRFRIYVFTGAGNAVTTTDILDASIEEALEAARVASRDNEHLWALALIDEDSRGLRHLVWLSGMDYNDVPSTVDEWRLRRQMQNRYLMAKHRRGLEPVLPNGLRVIRLFPEWGHGWPLWESFTDRYRLSGADLGLSDPLGDALYEWNELWQGRELDDPLPEGWTERGNDLFVQLCAELDGVAEVRPEYLF